LESCGLSADSQARAASKDGFFLRAESFFNVATEIENLDDEPGLGAAVIDSYGGRSLHEQSHGESFMALLMNRFGGKGLYLLDEPEAALSPQPQLAALARIHDLATDDSQFFIATHSPILMAYPVASIYQFDANGMSQVAYEETDHYQVMRSFLMNPERMLRNLLCSEERSHDRCSAASDSVNCHRAEVRVQRRTRQQPGRLVCIIARKQ
jgi:predicted ATPase